MLNAMNKAGIKVIVGTPTYAIPTWLAHEHPDVLVITPRGPAEYGRHKTWISPTRISVRLRSM
jgi:beta-galactosidase